jgi:hypothetical protein
MFIEEVRPLHKFARTLSQLFEEIFIEGWQLNIEMFF